MPSTIFTIATIAAGLLASTASAKGNVAIYWGQGAYQKELSVVCSDPSVDIVNIAFVNGFPTSRDKYPDTNFGNACGSEYFTNPDGTPSKLLANCPIITSGIQTCKQNSKKVLLSLGGGYPADYYLASDDAAKWLAEFLVGSFGPKIAGSSWPRPFGENSAVDGFDLDIESTSGTGDYKWKYYAELVNYIKALNSDMLISAAPQCPVPDAHLDDAISRAPFDYIFTQFYNTPECSAKLGYQQINQKQTGFTFGDWTTQLQKKSFKKDVKLYLGLPAGTNGANPDHYLLPEEANALINKYQNSALWGGVMLWEATVSQNNMVYCNSYSQWIKSSLDGTFSAKYKPAACSSSSTRSSTLVSSTRTSSTIKTSSTVSSTKISSTIASSKTSSAVSSKTSSAVSSKTSSAVSSKTSSIGPSTKSSSVVTSSTLKSSSYPASSSIASSSVYHTSSSAVVSSSSVHVSASSSSYVASSSSVPAHISSSSVEYSASSSLVASSEASSVQYSDYFSTAIPTESYSASSASVSPSIVYPVDVSSTFVHSNYPGDITSSASSYYEISSNPAVTSSASDYYSGVLSSVPAAITSSASEYYSSASSFTPAASESESASDHSVYPVSSSTADYDVTSSTTPAGASSTPCTTSTQLYPESSKTPEASSSASEYLSYSESSKIPEVSSSASDYYSTEFTKTPEASEYSSAYSASSTTPAGGASSTPCTTSTELYPESSKTPETSSATGYSYYSESSKVPEVSSKTSSEYPVEYPTSYPTVSTKTPEVSSSASEYIFYSESSKVPGVSSKASEYPVEYPTAYPVTSTKIPEASEASEYETYSTATPAVTKPAESTTTLITTTYLDTCPTGLTTKTTVITKTVCNACTEPSDKPEANYPEDWTTSVYVSKTLTVTITKPIHPATDVPAYPTSTPVAEYPIAPKPSIPAAEYHVGKEEVPSYETSAKSLSVPHEATKPSPEPEVPSYPKVPSAKKPSAPAAEKPTASVVASSPAVYPIASVIASKPVVPSYPEDATVTISQYVTFTKVATPVAYTSVAYATPVVHQGYPAGNGTVPTGTGAVKPSATGTGKPVKPSAYSPPEFEGAASKLSMGMTGVVAVIAFFML